MGVGVLETPDPVNRVWFEHDVEIAACKDLSSGFGPPRLLSIQLDAHANCHLNCKLEAVLMMWLLEQHYVACVVQLHSEFGPGLENLNDVLRFWCGRLGLHRYYAVPAHWILGFESLNMFV